MQPVKVDTNQELVKKIKEKKNLIRGHGEQLRRRVKGLKKEQLDIEPFKIYKAHRMLRVTMGEMFEPGLKLEVIKGKTELEQKKLEEMKKIRDIGVFDLDPDGDGELYMQTMMDKELKEVLDNRLKVEDLKEEGELKEMSLKLSEIERLQRELLVAIDPKAKFEAVKEPVQPPPPPPQKPQTEFRFLISKDGKGDWTLKEQTKKMPPSQTDFSAWQDLPGKEPEKLSGMPEDLNIDSLFKSLESLKKDTNGCKKVTKSDDNKYIILEIEAKDEDAAKEIARKMITDACKNLKLKEEKKEKHEVKVEEKRKDEPKP